MICQIAAETTFARRQLAMRSTLPSGLGDAFAQNATKQTQWAAFLKKNLLDAMDLPEVVALLRRECQKLGSA